MTRYSLTTIEMYRIISCLPPLKKKMSQLDTSLNSDNGGDENAWRVIYREIQNAVPLRSADTSSRRAIQPKIQRTFMGPRTPLTPELIQWIRHYCADALQTRNIVAVRVGLLSHPTLNEQQKLAVHGDEIAKDIIGKPAIAGRTGKWADAETVQLLQTVQSYVAAETAQGTYRGIKTIDWAEIENEFQHRSERACSRRFTQLVKEYMQWYKGGSPVAGKPQCDEALTLLGQIIVVFSTTNQAARPPQQAPLQSIVSTLPDLRSELPGLFYDDSSAIPLDTEPGLGHYMSADSMLVFDWHVKSDASMALQMTGHPDATKGFGSNSQHGLRMGFESSTVIHANSNSERTKHENDANLNDRLAEDECAAMTPYDIQVLVSDTLAFAFQVNLLDSRLMYYPDAWNMVGDYFRNGIWSNTARQQALHDVMNEHCDEWADVATFPEALARVVAKLAAETFVESN
ncbi:hypothetical protein BT63DRAFT_90403 [Microthyrium microscopicum]|uniref:Myb-like domain-containing protein n=1 Tax=Microthyrium microscopicum TaxID=703497 RepID=A0A6A6U0L8_9PEZI|nr:hypothetical protein BT63DRAFT_90403 [Microthyrium microscopicum]